MSFFSLAVILGWLGAGLIFFDVENIEKIKQRVGTFFILSTIYTLIGWLILWGCLPSLAWPLFGAFGAILIVWWIITNLVGVLWGSMDYDDPSWSHGWWFPIAGIIVIIFTAIGGSTIFRAQDYARLIGLIDSKTQKHWSQDIQPLDPTHTRLVPPALAISLAKTALTDGGSAIGSQFPLAPDNLTLQKINNDYWYLIPLDFAGFRIWTNSKFTGAPGYVKVSATDPYLKPILVLGKNLVYTLNACFDKNLERHLYTEFKGKVLKDYSFEEDDNGNVFWVISVCHPTIAYGGLVVDGVILCDPKTGEYNFVAKKDAESQKQYAWIDRVMPSEIIADYIDDWGSYKDGWWNSFWSNINLLEGETPTVNYSFNGECTFVTPITSTSKED